MISQAQINSSHSFRFVLGSFQVGGAEHQALALARFLRSQGHTVSIWAFNEPGPITELCDAVGIPWRLIGAPWPASTLSYVLWLLRFAFLLKRERVDILLPFTATPNLACSLIWRFTGAQVCIWNQRDEGRHLPDTWLTRFAIRQAALFVSNSQHSTDFLVRHFGVNPARTQVIPNAISLQPPIRSREAWRRELGAGPGTLIACMPANLHEFKDHATLLKAWKIVLDSRDLVPAKPLLVLAGRHGKTFKRLRQQTRELGIEERVRFLGPIQDLSGLLHSIDFGVFSSQTEGCPNAILECMAAGLPVVGTDISGIREAVGEDSIPWLAQPGDSATLAAHIISLARLSADDRHKIGKKLQHRISTLFTPDLVFAQWANLYHHLMTGRLFPSLSTVR